jgi:hypothetical protein
MYKFILHPSKELGKKSDNFHINIIQFNTETKKYRRTRRDRDTAVFSERNFLLLVPTQQTAKQACRIVETNAVAQVNAPLKDGIHLSRNRGRQFLFEEVHDNFHSLFRFVSGNSNLLGNQTGNLFFHVGHFVYLLFS